MNTLPYPILINIIEEWPALIYVNKYIYGIYKKYVKNKKYVTVEYYLKPCDKTLKNMCKKGKYIDIYTDVPKRTFTPENIRLLIAKNYTNWNYGLYGACRGGHVNMVNLMIEKGANNWDFGLYGACVGGHLNMVNLMIEKGANDWNWGLRNACLKGHMPVVKLMIKMGAKYWNDGLCCACKEGHTDIINLMIQKGASKCLNCDSLKHNF